MSIVAPRNRTQLRQERHTSGPSSDMLLGASPDTRRTLAVAPLIGNQRCYGECPASVRRGPREERSAVGGKDSPHSLYTLHTSCQPSFKVALRWLYGGFDAPSMFKVQGSRFT